MMQQKERLEKQLDFIREIDKEKEIFRQTYLADASRKENDAEHAWHMCLLRQSLLCRVSKAFLLSLARLSSHWHTRSRAWS